MENLQGEIWKPIIYGGIDYTGLYEVSNMGRVRSIKLKTRILKFEIAKVKFRYQAVSLYSNPIKKTVRVHLLVITMFDRCLKKNEVTDHKNSCCTDNRIDNLRIVSKRANCSKEKTEKKGLPCGVYFQKQKGKTYISGTILINLKRCSLSKYKTIETASQAYQIALSTHEQGKPLSEVFKAVDMYRESINLKPIKRLKQ